MKSVMFYEMAADAGPRLQEHFPAHRARLLEFQARGQVLMAGPFAEMSQGAMGIFSSRDAAEEFMSGDPFVIDGLVAQSRVWDWKEGLA